MDSASGESVDIFATMIKSPAVFIAGRIFVDARYMLRDPATDQYIILFSSRGNEDIAKEYSSTHDLNGSALAHAVISGHWYMPWLDPLTKKLIGTKIFYLSQSDFGGKVPQWIVSSFAPKAVRDTFDALVKAARDSPTNF